MNVMNDSDLLNVLVELTVTAGREIMKIYATDFEVDAKNDASPVTLADKKGEKIITAGLREAVPNIPIIAEEAASDGDLPDLDDPARQSFFLVDPLDGTREFINRTGEFTVNIALVRDGRPVLGVVSAPALKKLYAGIVGEEAWVAKIDNNGDIGQRKAIEARTQPGDGLVAVASRSHRSKETDAYLETINIKDFAAAGSSLKFCLLAEGKADIYPRLGRTMEWDTAAGQAVLEAAGGVVYHADTDNILTYGKIERGYDNPHFIAWADKK